MPPSRRLPDLIELNTYDRQWLMENGLTHENIAVIEDYIARFQQKYPKLGDCTACMAAYKRFMNDKRIAGIKAKQQNKAEAKMAQDKINGIGSNYQDGVWAPFNGKVYHDRVKMVNDARALGLEETGGSTDMEFMAERKKTLAREAKVSQKRGIRDALAQTLKRH